MARPIPTAVSTTSDETLALMHVTIRPDTLDSAVAKALIDDVQAEYVQRYGSGDATPVQASEFAPPNGRFLVAYVDEDPVGMGGWRVHEPGVVEIKRMYVASRIRGQGIARRILAELETLAQAAGMSRVILETGTMQPEAMALYESSGYQPIPGFGHYRDHANSRHYGKELTP